MSRPTVASATMATRYEVGRDGELTTATHGMQAACAEARALGQGAEIHDRLARHRQPCLWRYDGANRWTTLASRIVLRG